MNPHGRTDGSAQGLGPLQALTLAQTPEARQALFEQLIALVMDPRAGLGKEERRAVAGFAAELLRFAGEDSRAKAAEQLASSDDPPPDLLLALALDEIEIARPILSHSRNLTTDHLIQVAANGSSAHRCAVAGRQGLDAAVSDAIVDQADVSAIQVLAANTSVTLSAATLDRIATQSETSPALTQALLGRRDLPAVVAHRMFWWLNAAARRQMLERYTVDLGDLERILAEAGRAGVVKVPDHMAVKRVVDTVSVQSRMPVSGLIEVMRQGSLPRFTWALCERLGIEFKTGLRIVADPGGEALAVACRALKADRGQFITLFLLVDFKQWKRPRPASDLANIAAIYDRVTHHRAAASVAIWDSLERDAD